MLKKVQVEITKMDPGSTVIYPKAMSNGAAGMDVFAMCEQDIVIHQGETALIPTGFAIAIPEGYEAQIRPRSGLALKHGLLIPNSPGTIDCDYRGEVKIIMANISKTPFTIRNGDRIAQMVLCPVVRIEWEEKDALSGTERGDGGFGHTGI